MVGSGARESDAVQIGAITPQISTTAVQDIVESLPVTMVGEKSSDGSYMSSVIDNEADCCSCAIVLNAALINTNVGVPLRKRF